MTRAEHLAWAKQRALEFVDRGEYEDAMLSMLSDLAKHPETERSAGIGGMIAPVWLPVEQQTKNAWTKWIEGFN